MTTIKFKEKSLTEALAVKKADVFFDFRQGRLVNILINPIKVIEMRENNLLLPSKLHSYKIISLVHSQKLLKIPIVQGSGHYCGREKGRLRFSVSPKVIIKENDLNKWRV